MTAKVHIGRDFMKKSFAGTRIWTHDVQTRIFLPGLYITGTGAVAKTTTGATINITQSPYIQHSSRLNAGLPNLHIHG